jgi:hypothetical protein
MTCRSSILARLAGWLGTAALATGAHAQAPTPDETQHVQVTASMGPREEHAYADLLDAMNQFTAWQAAHLGARLRFRVQARRDPAVAQGLQVYVADPVDHTRTVLPLAPGGRFELPVSEAWRAHRASVRTDRPDGSLAWSVEVTHEGDDEHVRRLGDLREECHLDLYAATLVRGIKTPSFYALKPLVNLCQNRLVGWLGYADHPVFAVHVEDGRRHESLRGDYVHGGDASVIPMGALLDWTDLLRDRVYVVHTLMADSGWSDETRLTLVFADDPPQPDQGSGAQNTSPSTATADVPTAFVAASARKASQ